MDPSAPKAPEAIAPVERALSPGRPSWLSIGRWLRRIPPILWPAIGYSLSALVVFRAGLGSPGELPQGTNALNTFLSFWFLQHHPLAVWLYPFTDWGQPVPGFTGVTVLTPAVMLVDPGVLVRSLEVVSWVGAGLSMYAVVRRLGGTALAGSLAGFYYLSLAQTPQLFEGHVPTMISLALAPLFFLSLFQLLSTPRFRFALAAAVLLYLLFSIGDLGMLYFVVFFSGLLAVFAILRRHLRARYRPSDMLRIIAGFGALALLTLTWWFPYAYGVRPQYTTTITTTALPFSATTGENLGYAFVGYVQDNSFVHFTYHQFSYGLFDLELLALYFLIPLALLAYVIMSRNRDRLALYAGAVLGIVMASGHLFPVLAEFNGWIYDHVPYFDAIPAVFRWAEMTVLAYGVLLGLLLSDIQRGTWPKADLAKYFHLRRRGSPTQPHSAGRSARALRRAAGQLGPRLRRRDALSVLAVTIITLTVLQTFEVVAQPPGLFEYPAPYLAGYAWIRSAPLHGGILGVPFSGIYERSPWGGVTESSLLMAPYYTGGEVDIFEAGTPYSLALDTFVGNGLTYGYTRNMTKFLGGANIQYVVATRYSNWSYINSFAYPPRLSYFALANQTGLGVPTVTRGTQSIYAVPGVVGNVSFHPRYFLYFGSPSLLYQILDQPWYLGSGDVLVDGSSLVSGASAFAAHAAGIITTPEDLGSVPTDVLRSAEAAGVPIQIVAAAGVANGVNVTSQFDPWNASGGSIVTVDGPTGTLVNGMSGASLYAAGYRAISVSARVALPPGPTWLEASYDVASIRALLPGAPIEARAPLPYLAPAFAQAVEANNSTAPAPQNVSLVNSSGGAKLRWSFVANASAAQYLRLNVTNLSGWNGLSFDIDGNAQIPVTWRIVANATEWDVPAGETFVPIQGNLTRLSFYLPPTGYAAGAGPMTSPGRVSVVELVIPPGVNASSLTMSNFSLFRAGSSGYRTVSLGNLSLAPTGNLTVSAPLGTRINSVTVSAGAFATPTTSPFDPGYSALGSPTQFTFDPTMSGWGIVLLAQTFDPSWNLAGAGPALHAAGNVGLNAWLVDLTPASHLTLSYSGDRLESRAYEITLIAGAATVGAVVIVRRRLRGRRIPDLG